MHKYGFEVKDCGEPHRMMKKQITEAFKVLRRKGFFARQNFQCCQSCACAVIPDVTEKYVFYHQQDNDNFRQDGSFHLAWGSCKDKTEKQYKVIGQEIVDIMTEFGLKVEWKGKSSQRILIEFKERA